MQDQELCHLYEQIVETSPDWIWSINLQGEHTYSNPAIKPLMGYELDEVVGSSSFPIMHPGDAEWIQDMLGECVAQKKGWSQLAIRWLHKDGTVKVFESSAQPLLNEEGDVIGFAGIDRDITSQKESEKLLQLMRIAIEQSSDAIFWLAPDASIAYVNETTCERLGYTRDELLDMTVFDMDPVTPPALWEEIWNSLKQKGSDIIETKHEKKNGEIIPVEVSINYVSYGGNEYNFAFARDISERIEQEKERLRLQEEIIEAQRQALKELSTPIVPVLDGVLIMPLTGTLDSMRAQQVMEGLLAGIVSHNAQVVIIDITGVPVVDTGVANHLLQVTRAAALLGSECVLVGISPEIAQTIVSLGVDLSTMTTRGNLQSGIGYALSKLGKQIQEK